MRAEALVGTAAEGQHGRRAVAGDVEAIGLVVDGWVTVGCGGVGDDECRPSG